MKVLKEHSLELLLVIQNEIVLEKKEIESDYFEMGCGDTCAGSCDGSCAGSCDGSCAGDCEADCSSACESSCSGECEYRSY